MERVYVIENRVLLKYGVFDVYKIYKYVEIGLFEYKENMEVMVEDIVVSLKGIIFGGKVIYFMRGLGDFLVFDDEIELKEFG